MKPLWEIRKEGDRYALSFTDGSFTITKLSHEQAVYLSDGLRAHEKAVRARVREEIFKALGGET